MIMRLGERMKKTLVLAGILATLSSQASIVSERSKIHEIDTLKNSNYKSLITRVKFEKDLKVDLSNDDDIFFQNGVVITEADLDKTQAYCEIDTDLDDDNSFSSDKIIVTNTQQVTFKKGFIRAIDKVDVSPKLEKGYIEYDIDFISSTVESNREILDELECRVPLSITKTLTVGEVLNITGNYFSFDIIDIEQ